MPTMFTALLLALQATPAPAAQPAVPPAATASPDPSDAILARMLALYGDVCLSTFPDDKAVDALMTKVGAKALTADEAKVTLRDDPGRGWLVPDGDRNIQVMLELPPYHACSVRRMTQAGFADLSRYEALTAPFKAANPGFAPIQGMDMPMGGLQVHATGEARALPGGGSETLLIYDQRLRPGAKGSDASLVNVRFVHQIVSPAAR